ncbi:phage tail protein [Gilliamella sp. ESL0254]|uniref:phage tail protein n=1 Tax=Gilliamella sp. ESL0254 TaxID=2705035 RepID=UPI0015811D72|nr:phage tail protein [Gilliamella sp. ESL0254]NUF26917.1 hypothetical protein [Gilliamella sp. ESL0254]
MHRIDTSTAQRDKFGQGKNGFTRGNPQTGTPATQLDYLYCDAIQEEIANAIESAGFTLDKSKHDQLAMAIKEFVNKGSVKLNSSTDSTSETEAATPLAVKKVNDNAVIANANAISANSNANNAHNRINAIVDKFEPCVNESRVYSNNKKTYLFVRDDGIVAAYNTEKNKMVWGFDAKGELGVGTIHSSHVVGLSEHVTNMFTQSFGQNGYTRLPNGLIIQWGIVNSLGTDGRNGTLQSFFIAFPNACFSISTNDTGDGTNTTAAIPISTSQFKCWGKTTINDSPFRNTTMFYMAIGF